MASFGENKGREGDCPHGLHPFNCIACLRRELERLRRGDFTPEEFQALCHHLDERPGCTREAFEQGCREYQMKLFGADPIRVGPPYPGE